MKLFITFLLTLLITEKLFAQNLVSNPSFEDTVTCPSSTDEVYNAIGWSSFGASSNYFNSCNSSNAGVPENAFGFQNAATGNAYCGLYSRVAIHNYREFIGSQLSSPLIIGNKYFVSIKVSLADNSTCATNNIGVSLSTVQFNDSTSAPITNKALVNCSSIVWDTSNWTVISGSFIADSAYAYIIVGNFYSDSFTDSILYSSNLCGGAYYYIDDACISTDSFECDFNTGNIIVHNENFHVYPIPASDFLYITYPIKFSALTMYDIIGKEVYHKSENKKDIVINVREFPNGVYFIITQLVDTFQVRKVLIQK